MHLIVITSHFWVNAWWFNHYSEKSWGSQKVDTGSPNTILAMAVFCLNAKQSHLRIRYGELTKFFAWSLAGYVTAIPGWCRYLKVNLSSGPQYFISEFKNKKIGYCMCTTSIIFTTSKKEKRHMLLDFAATGEGKNT